MNNKSNISTIKEVIKCNDISKIARFGIACAYHSGRLILSVNVDSNLTSAERNLIIGVSEWMSNISDIGYAGCDDSSSASYDIFDNEVGLLRQMVDFVLKCNGMNSDEDVGNEIDFIANSMPGLAKISMKEFADDAALALGKRDKYLI